VTSLDSYNSDQKREIIMDYYLNPRRKQKPDSKLNLDDMETYYYHSNNCVDEITLIKLTDKNDYSYNAVGCAIFLSSTEIFLEEAAKKEFKSVQDLSTAFQKLINQNDMSDSEITLVGKLSIFSNVKKHLNRVECALMVTKVFAKVFD
jgi:nitrogen fixation NifU-like protein